MVKIVVFDSGFGSLSIIKEIRKKIKAEVVYFADQANFPYGKKSTRELKKIICRTINFLENKFRPDIIIVGSNTPSLLVGNLDSSKVIGVYPPLKEASKKSKSSCIGILTTQNVVKSQRLNEYIRKKIPKKIKVLKINASPLVELVESGKFIKNKQYCKKKIFSLLEKQFEDTSVDVVTLSSTHLPFLRPFFHEIFPKIQFIDPSETLALKIRRTFNHKKSKYNKLSIFCSGKPRVFQSQLEKIGIKRKVKFMKIN